MSMLSATWRVAAGASADNFIVSEFGVLLEGLVILLARTGVRGGGSGATRRRVGEVWGRMAVVLSSSEKRLSKKLDSSASEWRTGGIAVAGGWWLEGGRWRETRRVAPKRRDRVLCLCLAIWAPHLTLNPSSYLVVNHPTSHRGNI